jgi:iron complex transport system permease protein
MPSPAPVPRLRVKGCPDAVAGTRRTRPVNRPAVIFPLLLVVLVVSVTVGVAIGPTPLPPGRQLAILAHQLGMWHGAVTWPSDQVVILLQVRIPRVAAGVLVGAALATAGTLLQGLLRNPLADPYLIGVSSGAGLGATVAALLGPIAFSLAGFGLTSLLAFTGGLLTVLLVYRLAWVGGAVPVTTLLLAGFAVSAIMGAATTLLYTVSGQLTTRIRDLFAWLAGGISVVGWTQLAFVGPIMLFTLAVAWTFARTLNAFALGEEGAAYVGVHVQRQKIAIIAVSTLLTGCAVTLSGLVGFVGLVAPHAMRLLIGPNHRTLLPAAALGGASFLVLADLGARVALAPTELPVGIVTALLGGPFFLYLLQRNKRPHAL